MPPDPLRAVLIGAGNVGFHLGQALRKADVEILEVFSRNIQNAKELSHLVKSKASSKLSEISPEADLYILAIKDDLIKSCAATLSGRLGGDPLVVHTSGGTPSSLLQPFFRRYGVFYPLQTFSKETPVEFRTIPICVDAADLKDLELLESLGKRLSQKVYRIDDQDRSRLHVAAVFANNFSNHMFTLARDILEREGLPFELLIPLIRETVAKLDSEHPGKSQTGPAIRGDQATILRHLEYLEKFPGIYTELYQLLTKSIKDRPSE